MSLEPLSRRKLGILAATIASSFTTAGVAFGRSSNPPAASAGSPPAAGAGGDQGLSHSAEEIRQDVTLHAARRKVYEILTDSQQFDAVSRRSAAMKSAMAPKGAATEISRNVGGAFSLFGGYITGLQVELVPDRRLVQVWRAGSWKAGEYSLATFELDDDGVGGSKLVFHHRGFPAGTGPHLAAGWFMNYWQPLAEYLAQ